MTAAPPQDGRGVQRHSRAPQRGRRQLCSAAYRDDAMSLLVNEPGHNWEIDVLEDGSVDVEVYSSQGLCDDPHGGHRQSDRTQYRRHDIFGKELNHVSDDPPLALGRQEAAVLPHRRGRRPRAARRPLRRKDRQLRSLEAARGHPRLVIDTEKAKDWIAKGAQPTDRVLKLLATAGVGEEPERNNPVKALPKKRAQERAAAAATASSGLIAARTSRASEAGRRIDLRSIAPPGSKASHGDMAWPNRVSDRSALTLVRDKRRGSMAETTTDHDTIRQWAESKGGKPAAVDRARTRAATSASIRIMFPNNPQSEHGSLVEISWEEFFEEFDKRELALLFDEKSLFSKIVGRDTAEKREHGDHAASRHSGRDDGKHGGSSQQAAASKTRA